MRKTYAYSSIIIGILLGLWAGLAVNAALGIVVCLGVSIGGFIGIRALENAMYKGADAISDQIAKNRNAKKGYQQKADGETETLAERFKTTGMNDSPAANHSSAGRGSDISEPVRKEDSSISVSEKRNINNAPVKRFCSSCGAPLPDGAKFCQKCGRKI